MLPFPVTLKPGLPVTEQVVFAVKKAVVSQHLRPGDAFPSVRGLSQALQINPNTAQKIIGVLVQEGVLITTPAVGTVVAAPAAHADDSNRIQLLTPDLERLAVESRQLGLTLDQVQKALADQWKALTPESSSSNESR